MRSRDVYDIGIELKENPKIEDFENLLEGKPIAVLGSGPSLPESLKLLPKKCFKISVNRRPLDLVKADIVVSCDKVESIYLYEKLDMDIIKISAFNKYSEININTDKIYDGGFSSTVAVSLACFLGGNPVLLVGMDLYRGKPYFNSKDINHPCQKHPLVDHIKAWEKVYNNCKNPERIKSVGGPLQYLFGNYERKRKRKV